MNSPDLARVSDGLVLSAIVVYVLAMLGYAAEVALRARKPAHAVPRIPALAGAAAGRHHDDDELHDPVASTSLPGARPDHSQVARVAVSLTVLAVLLHAAGVLARGLAAGRAPWGNMYEFAVTGSLAAAGAYLVFLRRDPVRDLGAWIVGVVTLTLGLAVTVLYTPAGDLVPALNSYWLVVHVAAAIVAGGVFTVGAAATIILLAQRRPHSRRVPRLENLDRVAHAAHLFAFPVWTFAVLAGAIWAENAWGRYWGWDPKETWAFITWVLYAAYLHAQATAGWWRRKAHWFAVAGYAAFLFNFFGINLWISGLHSYAGV